MRLSTAILAAVFAFGIAHAKAAEAPADWVEVAAGAMFTVKAPPGTTFERIRTGDAFAGAFHGAGFDLAVEFGYKRDDVTTLAKIAMPQMAKVTIDSKPGTVVTGTASDPAHPYYAGLHVPAVENDIIGPLSLVINGTADKPETRATVERIYDSISFGFKN
uniref:Uncharacterized protein n=1 Tax=uncultured bacterium BLR7 TaxID=506523 RepID=C0INQ0_9BACT|nr:hypothetical protein AKSOIL_0094 [uncultured bacterium BLR7]